MALRRLVLPPKAAARRFPEAGEGIRYSSAIPSSTPAAKDEVDTRENEIVDPDFSNRNPHNLERLGFARKDGGWRTTWPSQMFWYRVRLKRSQNYVEAYVEHCSGRVVVSASTQEWAIKKHLHKTLCVTACENVGRVLAQRCLEAGINFVDFEAIVPWEKQSNSVIKFENAMKEGGVEMEEQERVK